MLFPISIILVSQLFINLYAGRFGRDVSWGVRVGTFFAANAVLLLVFPDLFLPSMEETGGCGMPALAIMAVLILLGTGGTLLVSLISYLLVAGKNING